jgi:hypothetical protein
MLGGWLYRNHPRSQQLRKESQSSTKQKKLADVPRGCWCLAGGGEARGEASSPVGPQMYHLMEFPFFGTNSTLFWVRVLNTMGVLLPPFFDDPMPAAGSIHAGRFAPPSPSSSA